MNSILKSRLLLGAGLLLALASCRSTEVDAPDPEWLRLHTYSTEGVQINIADEPEQVFQLDTLAFSAKGSALNPSADVVWYVNDKPVSKGKDFVFTQSLPGKYEILFRQGEKGGSKTLIVRPRFEDGLFLLNEGRPGKDLGKLTYLSAKHQVFLDSVYQKVNPGHTLGDVAQDLTFANGKIYIVTQNGRRGDSDGILTIAQAGTLEFLHTFQDEELAKAKPTHIAVLGERIYLRTGKGIYVGTETGGFTLIAGTEKAKQMRLVTRGQRVYAQTADSKILVVQGDQLIKSYELKTGKLEAMIPAEDGNLWIAYSSPNTLAKLSADPRNMEILESHPISQAITAGWGSAPILAAKGQQLFFSEAAQGAWGPSPSSKIYVHDFATKQTTLAFDFKTLAADGFLDTYYNSFGIDADGHLYYSGLKGFGNDYTKNRTVVLHGQTYSVLRQADGANIFPAGLFAIPTK